MIFRFVPQSVTLDDLERRNALRYFTEFGEHAFQHNRVDLWRNLCTSLLYFVVRVRCRRKESSRSLSHLLMGFLLMSLCPKEIMSASGYALARACLYAKTLFRFCN